MKENNSIKNWFIHRYSEIHTELNKLEKEIDNHIKNKGDLICNSHKMYSLKKRTHELIELLNKTREDERRIFNY
jgi:hypothetical protein